jgi:hypothetical protein
VSSRPHISSNVSPGQTITCYICTVVRMKYSRSWNWNREDEVSSTYLTHKPPQLEPLRRLPSQPATTNGSQRRTIQRGSANALSSDGTKQVDHVRCSHRYACGLRWHYNQPASRFSTACLTNRSSLPPNYKTQQWRKGLRPRWTTTAPQAPRTCGAPNPPWR